MIILSEQQKKIGLSLLTIGVAALIGLFSLISGNDPIFKPNFKSAKEAVWETRVSNDNLVKWIIAANQTMTPVAFMEPADCDALLSKTQLFRCYDKAIVDNVKKVRTTFYNFDLPMIVVSYDTDTSLAVAAKLKYLGYKATMLDGGFSAFEADYLTPVDEEKLDEAEGAELKALQWKNILYKKFSGTDSLLGSGAAPSAPSGEAIAAPEAEGC